MTDISPRGRLIVFEGTDGCGKSTQVKLLHQELLARGIAAITTREPTDGTFGQQIRQLYKNRDQFNPDQELELFLADRREHVSQFIEPALASGQIVICDRYFLSTAAYQGARGCDPQEILALNDFAPVPDLALVLHAPLTVGLRRIVHGRGETLNDFEQLQNLERVAAIFASLQLPYIRRVDASGDIAQVKQQVMHLVEPMLSENPSYAGSTL